MDKTKNRHENEPKQKFDPFDAYGIIMGITFLFSPIGIFFTYDSNVNTIQEAFKVSITLFIVGLMLLVVLYKKNYQ